MTLLAIRINRVIGAPTPAWDEEGDPINEDDWDFDDSSEVIVYLDTGDVMDIENGMTEVREVVFGWKIESEANNS